MSTYAIGDLQGCYRPLRRLLERIDFSPERDRLWFAGDMVNRGPQSLDVLRWIYRHRERCRVVLGNHDLHLLARALGVDGRRRRDTVEPILDAPDRDTLIGWLRRQPLFYREGDWAMVHAGLLPGWTLQEADARARRAEAALAGPQAERLLARGLSEQTAEEAELRETVAVLTRVRMLAQDGSPRFAHKGPPEGGPPGQLAWFAAKHQRGPRCNVLFGHWAALGHRQVEGAVGLDSGCIWGQQLTAFRLEDRATFHEPCSSDAPPGD